MTTDNERDDERPEPAHSKLQKPLVHEGAKPDLDPEETADDKATVLEPDGSPSPRASEDGT